MKASSKVLNTKDPYKQWLLKILILIFDSWQLYLLNFRLANNYKSPLYTTNLVFALNQQGDNSFKTTKWLMTAKPLAEIWDYTLKYSLEFMQAIASQIYIAKAVQRQP